jgi:chromosome segregation ATPase
MKTCRTQLCLFLSQISLQFSRKTSSASWQALVDEDRLLSRIDLLEKKLLCFSKPLTEDKLREEIMKLQNEKMLYQTSAKQALKKVYNERMEAIQKLGNVENALCSTEDECSLLRDQLAKTQSHTHETTQRLDAMQNQLDDKVTDYEEKMFKKETELKCLNSELNELQEKVGSYKVSEKGDGKMCGENP